MENITTKAFGNSNVDNDIAYFRKLKTKKVWSIIGKVLIYVILAFWAIGTIFPFLWAILNSFRSQQTIIQSAFGFDGLVLTNYKNLFAENAPVNVPMGYVWSLLMAGTVVIVTAIISAFAAFFIARYKGRVASIIYYFIIACMMFPIFSTIYPVFRFFHQAGFLKLNETKAFWAVVLPQIAGNISFTVILLTGFIKSLPIEVEESAYMDGASTMRTVVSIVFPMIKSAFATCAIFIFIWAYNDLYLQQLMLTGSKIVPLCLLMTKITTKDTGTDYGFMFAAVSVICVPIIIVYVCLQRFIIKGLTAGAVKG